MTIGALDASETGYRRRQRGHRALDAAASAAITGMQRLVSVSASQRAPAPRHYRRSSRSPRLWQRPVGDSHLRSRPMTRIRLFASAVSASVALAAVSDEGATRRLRQAASGASTAASVAALSRRGRHITDASPRSR